MSTKWKRQGVRLTAEKFVVVSYRARRYHDTTRGTAYNDAGLGNQAAPDGENRSTSEEDVLLVVYGMSAHLSEETVARTRDKASPVRCSVWIHAVEYRETGRGLKVLAR